MTELRFRQIHLDFHTSEHIDRIGEGFDPDEFVGRLVDARVNSVTCFARCHHGWIYYDTEASPERRHPHLTRNLLAEQIEACHARDIRVPIYTTIQWDHYTAEEHPEWLVVDESGCPQGMSRLGSGALYEPGFYRFLCVNTPYRDFLREHVRELLDTFPVDGFFFDIVKPRACSCRYCRRGMVEQGLEPSVEEDRWRYGVRVIEEFKEEMSGFVRRYNDECTIFYNSGHVGTRLRESKGAFTHFELESLPGGHWGYQHFPVTVRYARTLGLDTLSHTGKFHTTWGDFHSFKNPEALEYECFRMLAFGSKCLVGDQLHPLGRIDPDVYRLIGDVYRRVEEKEPWCIGARAVAEIGVFTPEEFLAPAEEQRHPVTPPIRGATRMLEEGGHQFDIVDSRADLTDYSVVILPDEIPVSAQLKKKLAEFVSRGGAVIASYKSGLGALGGTGIGGTLPGGGDAPADDGGTLPGDGDASEGDDEHLGLLGVEYVGDAPYSPDFIVPKGTIGEGLPETEHVMYSRGVEVKASPGTEVLADVAVPYFNRTYKHFCSHRHTPSSGAIGYPGITQNGRVIYFAHPLFSLYNQKAPRWCKTLFLNAIKMLLPEPLVRHDGPSSLQVTLNRQEDADRWVLHLLHYIPQRKSEELEIVEDVIPLYDVPISVRVPREVAAVVGVPEGEQFEWEKKGERVEFVLPKLCGHQMIALDFSEEAHHD